MSRLAVVLGLCIVVVLVGCGDAGTPQISVPSAEFDTFTTLCDNELTVDAPGVLGNDSVDPALTLSVAHNDPESAVGGVVSVAADGSFSYTPVSGYVGVDVFTYTVTDGSEESSSVVVINVEEVPGFSPIAKAPFVDPGVFNYGTAVAVSGDYAVVGANEAAYVLCRHEGGPDAWGQVAKLTGSDSDAGDNFGSSVSISGDIVVVGARTANSVAGATGAAYVFEKDYGGTGNWGERAKLVGSTVEADQAFGFSVAVSGDWILASARGDWSDITDPGEAFIFSRDAGGADSWGEVARLTASDAEGNDRFGHSVALCDDIAIVGAYWEDEGGSNAGAAYVYARDNGGLDAWGEAAKLVASNAGEDDYFGFSVGVCGERAIVGAYQEDGGGSNSGAAYIFGRDVGGTDNWGEAAKITTSDIAAGDTLGYSVALGEDYALVGAAYKHDFGVASPGAAYLFHRHKDGIDAWGEVNKLSASDPSAHAFFGCSAAIDGQTGIVGAWQGDSDTTDNVGAAYLFGRNP